MGQAEWMLIVTIGSLVGVAAMGFNLVSAVWNGRAPRPVPLATWLGVMVLAASVLWTRWDEDEASTIVAAVSTAEPVCSVPGGPLHAEASLDGALVKGTLGSQACHVWALIRDPRTGIFWVQGPADVEGSTWSLSLSLASADGLAEKLPYMVSIAAVGNETHNDWLDQSVAYGGIISIDGPLALPWVARDLLVTASSPLMPESR